MITELNKPVETNLIAVEVPMYASNYRLMINILLNFNSEEPNLIELPCKCDKILGGVTKDHIGFDVEPYVGSNTGLLYTLLSGNGLYFENPYDSDYIGLREYLEWEHYEDKLRKGKLLIIEKL